MTTETQRRIQQHNMNATATAASTKDGKKPHSLLWVNFVMVSLENGKPVVKGQLAGVPVDNLDELKGIFGTSEQRRYVKGFYGWARQIVSNLEPGETRVISSKSGEYHSGVNIIVQRNDSPDEGTNTSFSADDFTFAD